MSRRYDYDVLVLSDLRYPGGNSASIVEEIKAQSDAGYSTGLMHVAAPHMARRRSFNRKIVNCVSAGMAELVPVDRAVSARVLVMRQPRLFTADPAVTPRIDAGATVLVVNHPPSDALCAPGEPYYDVADVRARVERLFGESQWAPIGPLVRDALLTQGDGVPLRDSDWVNIVDVGDWWVDRSHFRADRPVIGRHSRGHLTKWPASAAEILAAYPADGAIDVKVLGGAEPAIRLLGACPAAWTVHPFGAMPVQQFLREIDFFVYFHHPGWVESFGRNIIEAMASGCPAILPPHFERVFGDGCLYAPARDARAVVERLYRDPGGYRDQSERGIAHVEQNFGTDVHLRRLAQLIGEPAPKRPRAGRPRRGRRTLLVSGEVHGAGSVTRLIRSAAVLPGEAVLLASWPALERGRQAGLLCELLSDDALDPGNDDVLADRVEAAVRHHAIDRAVIDARTTAAGIVRGLSRCHVPCVALDADGSRAAAADGACAIVPVGDGVAGGPRMLTLRHRKPALDRDEARAAIGVPRGAPLALLCPGADLRRALVARLPLIADELLRHGWTVVFAEPLVGGRDIHLPPGVRRAALHPLPRVLAAFDVAVVHPGRTLVPELVEARVPTLLVALRADPSHEARGIAAQRRGVALWTSELDEGLLERVADLSGDAVRTRLTSACSELPIEDAAPAVAAASAAVPASPPAPVAGVMTVCAR